MPRPQGQEIRLDQRWFREALPTGTAHDAQGEASVGPGAGQWEQRTGQSPAPPTQGAKPAEAFFKPEILLPEELIQRHNV